MLKNKGFATKFESFFFGSVSTLVLVGFYLAIVDESVFRNFYVMEDGLIEWLTVIALAAGASISFRRLVLLRSEKTYLFLGFLGACSLVFLFGAGEEISWGQRIFNLETPEGLKSINAQGELNLHNIRVGKVKINKLVFGLILGILIGIYLSLVPLLYAKSPKAKRIMDSCAVPIPRPIHIICFILLFFITAQTPSGKRGEIREFLGASVFLSILLSPANREIFEHENKKEQE